MTTTNGLPTPILVAPAGREQRPHERYLVKRRCVFNEKPYEPGQIIEGTPDNGHIQAYVRFRQIEILTPEDEVKVFESIAAEANRKAAEAAERAKQLAKERPRKPVAPAKPASNESDPPPIPPARP